MKRIVSWLMTVMLLASMIAVGGVTVPAVVIHRDGDVNGDGTVSTYDARLLLVHTLADTPLSDAARQAVDLNGNGEINTTDVRLVMLLAIGGSSEPVSNIDLLAPTVDDWNNPVGFAGKAYCTIEETVNTDGGYSFVNVTESDEGAGGAMLRPYTWPYAACAYDAKILLPSDAVIEYDLTVSSSAANITLFMGGDLPHFDDGANPNYMVLNPFISDNLDPTSGDLLPGTYKGSVPVSSILEAGLVPDECRPSGHLWLSGIKIYVVGYSDSYVTVRKLCASTGYRDEADVELSADPLSIVRSSLVDTAETAGLTSLTGLELYENGARTSAITMNASADNKKIYRTVQEQRVINYADGYRMDIPVDWQPDYSLSALRSRYVSDDTVLTVSKEEESPYANTTEGWNTYLTEWLNKYIGNESFLANNYIRYTRSPLASETTVPNHTVMIYDIAIDWQGNLEMPHYSIAIIRPFYVYNRFYLMVLKSKAPTHSMMDRLLRSFEPVTVQGTAVNTVGQYERRIPSQWNEATKAYYNKLVTQDSTDWGFFSYSMLESTNEDYASRYDQIVSERNRLESAMNFTYDIQPTYTHLSYGSSLNPFPLEMAQELAGGNGFNGKPVLQYTYQYTMTNNQKLDGPTPVFNVLRGDYDAHFRQFARDIKAYGQPVLFRLNNEMNTDWTSYCGLVSLLDPDIFVMGWQHLYDIFEEEGVDNCIWIFNPFTPTYPNCSWGDPLCYMPGADYVQMLGLTDYEMGNESNIPSFQTMYTGVYDINKDYFINLPWIISEFACGAGGEVKMNWSTDVWESTTKGRNQYKQYYWINAMFTCLNNRNNSYYDFCKNIKGAVWFNCNDYTTIDETDYIVNYLKIEDNSSWAINAFKNGFAAR